MSKSIVYTSVFGNYDDVSEQKLPTNWDWMCFDESNSLSLYSDTYKIMSIVFLLMVI